MVRFEDCFSGGKGKVQPDDVAACLTFARYCQRDTQRYATAARFYGEAFAAGQQLADKVAWPDHYDAACAAALAGCGKGADAESLDNQERARLRQQALNWLRAELRAILEKSLDKADSAVGKQMEQWLKDAAFADVRGAESLARL